MTVDLLEEARRRLDAGDPRSARRLAAEALGESRISGSPESRARAAHLVGEALFVMGEIAAARVLAGEALRLNQASGYPEALGSGVNLVGVIEVVEGRLDEAVFLLRRSFDLREQAGPGQPGRDREPEQPRIRMWRTEEQDEALEPHEEALPRCERSLGENHVLPHAQSLPPRPRDA